MTESGDRVMNLRNAIACFESALHVYSEQNYPQEYKTTKINLRKAQDALDGLDD
jgi:Na+-transporting NADH:ubiquinone oxidoreductase subunit NqrF